MKDLFEMLTNFLFAIVFTLLLIGVLTATTWAVGIVTFVLLTIVYILLAVYNTYNIFSE